MITADQLYLHALGDYILQSDWMANLKRTSTKAAYFHAATYTIPFLLLTKAMDPWPLWVIFGTHFFIDRFGLARYVVWAKNHLGPKRHWWYLRVRNERRGEWVVTDSGTTPERPELLSWAYWYARVPPFSECAENGGYPKTCPALLATILMIIADNILHVGINALALRYL